MWATELAGCGKTPTQLRQLGSVRWLHCLMRRRTTRSMPTSATSTKLEKWTRDRTKIDRLLYAGNNLDKARDLFAKAIKHRPKIRLTIRQRTRILDEYPRASKPVGEESK